MKNSGWRKNRLRISTYNTHLHAYTDTKVHTKVHIKVHTHAHAHKCKTGYWPAVFQKHMGFCLGLVLGLEGQDRICKMHEMMIKSNEEDRPTLLCRRNWIAQQ